MSTTIPYKSYCWSFGTTSFRTKNFNRTIEQQLSLLHEFWSLQESQGSNWQANNALQAQYYEFMKERGFVEGNAPNKPKDAREKTSGLVQIGLIDAGRRLTSVGEALLEISRSGDFSSDNFFEIPKDSYIYLRQLLKTSSDVDGKIVRPFIVLLYVLSRVGSLSFDEFTYLLPLCTTPETTEQIISGIETVRRGENTINGIILERIMGMDNYQEALRTLCSADTVDDALICEVGLNRKSRKYDKPYLELYNSLYYVFCDHNLDSLLQVFEATKGIKIGGWWRSYLFNTSIARRIERNPASSLNRTVFDNIQSDHDFRVAFFKTMHLFKVKATLSDYLDLNRRYLRTTDIILFGDESVRLDIVPKHYFDSVIDELYRNAFIISEKLRENCGFSEIADCLTIAEVDVIEAVNDELGTDVTTIAEARTAIEDVRYHRLHNLINEKFTDSNLITLLDMFAARQDNDIRAMVTDDADIPTIFEYVLGIIWYKASEYRGRILDYMKLSLDADLLPKTHAAGGEADIVYEYEECAEYPAHSLLLEATLADSTNQRRMEMEPVSRHLGQHLIRTENSYSYCVFSTIELNINVIADFRSRKNTPWYDTQDYRRYVSGMKIIPIETAILKHIIENHLTYSELYPIFEEAFQSELPPPIWYQQMICDKI